MPKTRTVRPFYGKAKNGHKRKTKPAIKQAMPFLPNVAGTRFKSVDGTLDATRVRRNGSAL